MRTLGNVLKIHVQIARESWLTPRVRNALHTQGQQDWQQGNVQQMHVEVERSCSQMELVRSVPPTRGWQQTRYHARLLLVLLHNISMLMVTVLTVGAIKSLLETNYHV